MLTKHQRLARWRQVDGSLARVGEAHGVSRSHVLYVLRGDRRSRTVEAAIAEVLGVPADVAFPPYPAPKRQPVAGKLAS